MEELNIALAELITQATSGISQSVGFLQAELPDVIVQLLAWNAAYSAIICAAGLAGVILVPLFGVWVFRKLVRDDEWSDHPEVIGIGSLLFPFIMAATMINLDWLQIWIAPKVWLIEYAAGLLK